MENFIKRFIRISDGIWECVSFAELAGPNGRIQVTRGTRFTRGTNFMGIDLAELLDRQREKENRRTRP